MKRPRESFCSVQALIAVIVGLRGKAIATAVPWREGDNVVLCAGLEHPNNVLPWVHLRRLGVEVRVVEPHDGAIEPAAIVAAIDGRTRVVTCSSVTFAPGLRVDLGTIGRTASHRRQPRHRPRDGQTLQRRGLAYLHLLARGRAG